MVLIDIHGMFEIVMGSNRAILYKHRQSIMHWMENDYRNNSEASGTWGSFLSLTNIEPLL